MYVRMDECAPHFVHTQIHDKHSVLQKPRASHGLRPEHVVGFETPQRASAAYPCIDIGHTAFKTSGEKLSCWQPACKCDICATHRVNGM